MKVNILEAKNHLSQLIKSARTGEDVIIAKRGKPVARLVAIGDLPAGTDTGSTRMILDWLEKHRIPTYARRSARKIDAAIQEERDAWD